MSKSAGRVFEGRPKAKTKLAGAAELSQMHDMADDLTPFGRWMLRDEAARRWSPLRYALRSRH
jgi:hypothetical protein